MAQHQMIKIHVLKERNIILFTLLHSAQNVS